MAAIVGHSGGVDRAHHFPPDVLEEIVEAEADAQVLISVSGDRLLITHASRAAQRLFGLRNRLPETVPLGEVLPPSLQAMLTSTCRSVWDSGKPVNIADLEWPHPRRPQPRWMDVRVRRLYGGLSLKCTDVSERHRSREELAQGRARYKMLAEYSSDVVFSSTQGTLTWVSPSVTSVLGWKPAELVGHNVGEFVHPDDMTVMMAAAVGVDAGRPARYEARFRCRSGDWLWLAITARPLFDDRGHVAGRIGSGRDISGRMAIERELQESQKTLREEREALRSILDSSLDPQLVAGAVVEDGAIVDFEFIDCNSAATAYLRTNRVDLLGKRLGTGFPGAASQRMGTWMRNVLETGQPIVRQTVELFPRIADGQRRYYDISITAMKAAVTFTWRDVTETVEQSAALARSEELFRLTAKNSPIALCLIDAAGAFMGVNHAMCDLLGRDEQTLLTMTWQELTHPDDLDVDLDLVQDLLDGRRETYRLTKRYLKPDGEVVWGELSVSCVREADGKLQHFISQILDVTELIRQRQAVLTSERHYRLLAEYIGDIVATVTEAGVVRWVSPSVTTTLGWDIQEVLGAAVSDFIVPDDWVAIAEAMAASRPGMGMSGTFRARRHDGSVAWVDALATTTDENGEVLRLVRLRDVDEEVRARQRLARSEQRFRTAIAASVVGTALIDPAGRITQANDALCRLLGRPEVELVGTDLAALSDDSAAAGLWRQVVSGESTSAVAEVELNTAHGVRVWVQQALAAVIDDDGEHNTVVAQFVDISSVKQAHALLEYEANHDALTGLKNRKALMAHLAAQVGRPGVAPAVLYCDIDGFKPVNDTFGHAVGDAALAEVARRIRLQVPVPETVGRVGGDEFVVIVTRVDGEDEAIAWGERIAQAVAEPMILGEDQMRLTVSIGVAMAVADDDAADVLAKADQAMYAAKQAGRNRVSLYGSAIGS